MTRRATLRERLEFGDDAAEPALCDHERDRARGDDLLRACRCGAAGRRHVVQPGATGAACLQPRPQRSRQAARVAAARPHDALCSAAKLTRKMRRRSRWRALPQRREPIAKPRGCLRALAIGEVTEEGPLSSRAAAKMASAAVGSGIVSAASANSAKNSSSVIISLPLGCWLKPQVRGGRAVGRAQVAAVPHEP